MKFIELKGPDATPHIPALAELRTQVFKEWPYVYDGDLQFEEKYLRTYFQSSNSLIVFAYDKDKVVGAATAIWLPDADPAFQKPFVEKKIPLSSVCYFGESVLLPEYRGRGTGQVFMQSRENFARSLSQVDHIAFCAVVRPQLHILRPHAYISLDAFWEKWGFQKDPNLKTTYKWKDIGEVEETEKSMQFWLKPLK